jgi:hypothetical protein
MTALTAHALASALDAVNNAVIGHAHNGYSSTAASVMDVASMLAVFAQAVADQLRQDTEARQYDIGDNTMRHVFAPAGLTNLSDLQAVVDQVETALSKPVAPSEPPEHGLCYINGELSYYNGEEHVPVIAIVPEESPHLVSTHGGPAHSVTWRVMLYGTQVHTANDRYPARRGFDVNSLEPPGGCVVLAERLRKAILAAPENAAPVANASLEVARLKLLLKAFRWVTQEGVTQWNLGAGMLNPIWSDIANALGDESTNELDPDAFKRYIAPIREEQQRALIAYTDMMRRGREKKD